MFVRNAYRVLVSKVVEAELFIAASDEASAREIAIGLAADDVNEGDVLTSAADPIVDEIAPATESERRDYKFVDHRGVEFDFADNDGEVFESIAVSV